MVLILPGMWRMLSSVKLLMFYVCRCCFPVQFLRRKMWRWASWLVTRHTSHVTTLTWHVISVFIKQFWFAASCCLHFQFNIWSCLHQVRISYALLHCTVEFCIDSEPLIVEVCSLQPFRQLSCFQPSEIECYHLSWRGGKHLFQTGLYLVLSCFNETFVFFA